MATFTKQQYIEIAGGGLFVALITWMLYHALGKSDEQPAAQNTPPPAAPPLTQNTLPSIGYEPLKLPDYSSSHGGCNCGGCGVGQTYSPSIQSIIDQTNAALAVMRQSSVNTLNTLAQIGNEGSNGLVYYIVEDE